MGVKAATSHGAGRRGLEASGRIREGAIHAREGSHCTVPDGGPVGGPQEGVGFRGVGLDAAHVQAFARPDGWGGAGENLVDGRAMGDGDVVLLRQGTDGVQQTEGGLPGGREREDGRVGRGGGPPGVPRCVGAVGVVAMATQASPLATRTASWKERRSATVPWRARATRTMLAT